jgi:hypothetical protein
MQEQARPELLDQLFAEIERGWRDRRDRAVVYRLSAEHPALREQLYEFFEDLILGAETEAPLELQEAEGHVWRWIQSSGVDLGIAAAQKARAGRTTTTPTTAVIGATESALPTENTERQEADETQTWIAFLRRRSHQRLPELAKALPNVNSEYLVLVSRHPDIVPTNVCRALATFVEERWRIPVDESLRYLQRRQIVVRAASRSRSFETEPTTFKDLLERSDLSAEQKTFWLEYAERV